MALYLHSIGIAPELIGRSYREYLGSLGRQMQQLDPELRREAKRRGRRIAREVGLEKAVGHLVHKPRDPVIQRVAKARLHKLLNWPPETPPCPSCRVKKFNMPKRSWPSKESAEQERAKHKDDRLVVYPYPVHPGYWHLGHIRHRKATAA